VTPTPSSQNIFVKSSKSDSGPKSLFNILKERSGAKCETFQTKTSESEGRGIEDGLKPTSMNIFVHVKGDDELLRETPSSLNGIYHL
jgi:hypothetical protein